MTALHFAHDKGLSFCKTFANDEGDEPSRVGATMDPLMDGMEQLDTVISFRDGGPGIARELQRAASRGQASRSATFRAGATNTLCLRPSATLQNSRTSCRTKRSCYGARILTRLLRHASLSRVSRPMSHGHSERFAILHMFGTVGKVLMDEEMAMKLQVCS